MWHYDKDVAMTYAHHTTQSAWANISDLGWKRIKDGAADGCTNLFIMMNTARANNRKVHVFVDGTDRIATAYML